MLFDRLCALAVADHVVVLLALDAGGEARAFDLAELLTKAAREPGLDIWLVPPPRPRQHDASKRPRLDRAGPACLRSVEDALTVLDRGDRRSLRVHGCSVSTTDELPDERTWSRPDGPMLFVAADRAGWREQLSAAAGRGIAFSVGAIDPSADFNVASADGVLAALDALVDLRSATDLCTSSGWG